MILNIGIINKAKEIVLITKETSPILLPPVKSPTINLANNGANKKLEKLIT